MSVLKKDLETKDLKMRNGILDINGKCQADVTASCLGRPKQNSWVHSLKKTHKPANKKLTDGNESALTDFERPYSTEFAEGINRCFGSAKGNPSVLVVLPDTRFKKEIRTLHISPLAGYSQRYISSAEIESSDTRPKTALTTRRHIQPKVVRNTHSCPPVHAKRRSALRSRTALKQCTDKPNQDIDIKIYSCGQRTSSSLDNLQEMGERMPIIRTRGSKLQLEKKTKKLTEQGTEIPLDKEPLKRLLFREREPSFVLTPPGFDVRYFINDEIRPVARDFSELTEEQKRSVAKCKHWISKYGMYMAGGERFHLARQT